jgi:ribosome-associated protein
MDISTILSIPDEDLSYTYTHSSGLGGQNINKVSSAVQLRFNLRGSYALPWNVKQRLIKLAGSKMTSTGFLILESKRFRSQERNRREAEERLKALILRALVQPRPRKPTSPSPGAKLKRVQQKKMRGETKRLRKSIGD